jgi:hypothetical protein
MRRLRCGWRQVGGIVLHWSDVPGERGSRVDQVLVGLEVEVSSHLKSNLHVGVGIWRGSFPGIWC